MISFVLLLTIVLPWQVQSGRFPSAPNPQTTAEQSPRTNTIRGNQPETFGKNSSSQHASPPPQVRLPIFTDVSPGAGARLSAWQSSTGRIHSLTQNGNRLYAAAPRAGLWRSSDGGVTWSQLTYPLSVVQTGRALPGPVVIDVSVDPGNPDRVLAVSKFNNAYRTGDPVDGLYFSTDAGATWRFVHHAKNCGGDWAEIEGVAFVSSSLAVTWGGCEVAFSSDGLHWNSSARGNIDSTVTQVVIDPITRKGYACGPSSIANPMAPFWSTDDFTNSTWTRLNYRLSETSNEKWCGVIQTRREEIGGFWHALAINPRNNNILYVSTYDDVSKTNNSRIWKLDLSSAPFTARPLPFPSPPPEALSGTSRSGAVYISTKPHQSSTTPGFLLFFGNSDRLFASDGEPIGPGSWMLMDKLNPLTFDVHVDSHAVAINPSFDMRLSNGTDSAVLSQCLGGTIWAANDGGVYKSVNCGQTWMRAEGGKINSGTGGLSILYPLLIGVAASPRRTPVIAIGTGDNGDFYSLDGGVSWAEPNQSRESDCGDCGDWFVDVLDPTWIMAIARADGGGSKVRPYTITEDDVSRTRSLSLINSGIYKGSQSLTFGLGDATTAARPVIQTLPNELGGNFQRMDIAFVACCTTSPSDPIGVATLVRTNDPGNPVAARVIGTLPRGSWMLQSSGGHTNTSYFIWNTETKNLLRRDSNGIVVNLIPAQGASMAARYFVNPYDPTDIYIVEPSSSVDSTTGHLIPAGVKRWIGGRWVLDQALTVAASSNGRFTMDCNSFPSCLINDMIFVPGEHTRFIAGKAGVFYSLDAITWRRLFTTEEIPSVPSSLAFDKYVRSLYVGLNGRGVIRFDQIPSPKGRIAN